MRKVLFVLLFVSSIFSVTLQSAERFTGALLWRISGNGLEQPSYIFGSHHLIPFNFVDSVPGLPEIMKNSQKIVGEIDLTDINSLQLSILPLMTMPDPSAYRSLMSEDVLQKMEQSLSESMGMKPDDLLMFKPTVLSSFYLSSLYKEIHPQYDPLRNISIDQYIQNRALSEGKKVQGLETAEEQAELLYNTNPIEEQIKQLSCMLENEQFYLNALVVLEALYKKGSLQELYQMSKDNVSTPCPISDSYIVMLNEKRNQKWMDVIPSIINESSTLIVVGALHLPEEEGLLNQLSLIGYTVEPVN